MGGRNVKHNILVVGVGGQGVVTLGKIIAVAGKLDGFEVTGYENKGGAQRGGKVSNLISLYSEETYKNHSARVISGGIDTVLSTDLFETARYTSLYNVHTDIISELKAEIPALYRGKDTKELKTSVLAQQLQQRFPNTYLDEFTRKAIELTNSSINTNLVILMEGLSKGILPLKREAVLVSASKILGEKIVDIIANNIYEINCV